MKIESISLLLMMDYMFFCYLVFIIITLYIIKFFLPKVCYIIILTKLKHNTR